MVSTQTSVGTNLAAVNYWSTEFPFIDRMKSAGQWIAQGADAGPVTVDANGYPTSMNGAVNLYAMVALDPPSAGTDKNYVLTYTGTANFRIPGATIISSKPGEIVFQYNGTGSSQQIMVSGIDASNPPTNIHLVRQDQVSLFQQGELFNPAFVDKVSQLGTLRFMDWMQTNTTTIQNWSDRTTMSTSSWATTANNSGVPIEAMVALANEAHTNMWINIPTQAGDDYVRQMLTYVRDHLDPSLKVEVEYSNEVWNTNFQQSAYAQQMANKLWGVDANGNGVIDASEAVARGTQLYYGYRAAQIAAIGQAVFGADAGSRLENVIATQTASANVSKYVFQGVTLANLGTASSLFSDLAVTTYFGTNMSGTNPTDRATILGWANSGSAGLDAAFNELLNGGTLTAGGALPSIIQQWVYQETVAKANGLNMVAYEGGIDLNAYRFSAADQPVVMAFFARLEADPRMQQVYQKMIDAFSAAGGTALNTYTDAQSDRAQGLFGTLKSIYGDVTPAWAALIAQQAKAAADNANSPSTPPPTSDSSIAPPTSNVSTPTPPAPTKPADNTLSLGNGGGMLTGGDGSDTLTGGNGNDYLDGGAGADTMRGGAGNDTYIVDNAGDVVIELPNQGTDEVRTTLASYTLGDNVENLTYAGSGAFTGTGNALANVITGGDGGNKLYGGDGNDTLVGGAGDDYLDGGAGNDRMRGGAGNDIYIVDSASDVVTELPNEGIDEVRTSLSSYTLSANVENLTYTGSGAFTGTGNALDNVLIGNPFGASRLSGADGNDTLIGGTGNDYLDGGSGADTMTGGSGDDTYVVDNPGDVVIELANGGTDQVLSSISYSLSANVENLRLTGTAAIDGTGNELNNTIYGNAANNTLSGGGGDDILFGGDGNDTLYGGDGNDRLMGENGNDTLVGGAGNDILNGGAGNDILIGGAGKDSLTGGAGADRFVFAPGDLAKTAADADIILDFNRAEGDKIDLSQFDANTNTSAKDSFTFIGDKAFTHHAGELRVQSWGTYWNVIGDTDGDGVADFVLNVSKGSGALIQSDFILG